MRRAHLAGLLGVVCFAAICYAQDGDLRVPANAVAGTAAVINTTGGGSATFYLVGPSGSSKRDVKLGDEIPLAARDLQSAGRYLAIVCSDSCRSADFFVAPAKPVSLIFLVHPSRAPVGQNDIISGVALPFDEFHNMVFTPTLRGFSVDGKRQDADVSPRDNSGGSGMVSHQFWESSWSSSNRGLHQ